MSLEKATASVKDMASSRGGAIGNSVKFVFPEGVIFLDDSVNPTVVTNSDSPAACTVRMELNDFMKLLNGELNPMGAFMSGLLKIDGDMSIAMKLTSLF